MFFYFQSWTWWTNYSWKKTQRYLCHSWKTTWGPTKSGSSWKRSSYQVRKKNKTTFLKFWKNVFSRCIFLIFFRAKRHWRKAVTGDPDKRIRDHMKETPQVKMLDKISFTMGVIVICLSEWLILRQPNLFSYFYYSVMAVLLAYR